MKVLVLGGAGFIGQHLTHRLLADNNHVTIIDNLQTALFNHDNFSQYGKSFEFIEADLTELSDDVLLDIIKQHDLVYQLAGAVGVDYVDKNPLKTMMNNVQLSTKLVPLFAQANVHVVFASTSEVYGNGPVFDETAPAVINDTSQLRWGYATAKLMTEFLIKASTFPYNIVRFFNVVGPGQLGDFGMVLPRFVTAAKANEDLIIHGDGQQVRAFCHINDAIDALVGIISVPNEVFNIGNDTPVTIKELAVSVIDTVGSSSKLKFVPYNAVFSKNFGDIMYRVPNITKLKTTIGYSPKHRLTDIIKDMA